MIEEVKPGPVEQMTPGWVIFRAEEDGRSKDALKTLRHPAVIAAILGKPEEVQDPGGAVEMDGSALLLEGECSNPNWKESILPERQAEVRMTNNVKEEFSVPALVHKLVFGKRTQRNATEHEWPGIEGNFLFPLLTVLANELNGLQAFGLHGGDTNGRQD